MSVGGLDVYNQLSANHGRLYSGDGQGGDGHGDKSFRDSVDSLPSGYCMCAYAGFTLVNSTSSTSGSFSLLRTHRLSITLPGAANQIGKNDPQRERRRNPRIFHGELCS